MFKLLLSVALTVVCVEYSNACSCFPIHPQIRFCDADFVFKGQIVQKDLLKTKPYNTHKYKVKVTYNYKKLTNHKKTPFYTYIYTAAQSSLCGVDLPVSGNKWLILGNSYQGKMKSSMCEWNKKFRDLTTYQKKALKLGRYKNGCACVNKPDAFRRDVLCHTTLVNDPCYSKHAICTSCGPKCCKWIKEAGKCTNAH